MRPASLLLALSLLACEGDVSTTPPPDERAVGDGATGAAAAPGPAGVAGAPSAGAPAPADAPPPAGATLELLDDSGDCAGLVPSRVPEPVVVRVDPAGGACGPATSDGTGAVAIAALRDAGASWRVHGPDGARRGAFDAEAAIVPAPRGFHALVVAPDAGGGDPRVEHVLFGADGAGGARTTVTPDPAEKARFRWSLSRDPDGGALAVVRATNVFGNHWSSVAAHRFDGGGAARWPGGVAVSTDDSALEPMFLGGGVSTAGDALVLAQDSAFLDASRLDADGHGTAAQDMAEPSDAVVGPGVAHVVELVPLLDGSLAVRSDGTFRRAYAPGATTSGPLPAWLAERASSTVRATRGGAGYAALPAAGAAAPDCAQRIELVSPGGRLCGRVVLREEGGSCTTGAVDQGWDGTVVQQSGRDACTYRWWPGLLGR